MECCKPFSDFVALCAEGIQINTDSAELAPVDWEITTPLGKVYTGSANPAVYAYGTGIFIPADALPDGFLCSPYQGVMKLRLKQFDKPLPVKLAAYYDEIEFTVKDSTDNEKYGIGIPY